MPRFDSINFFVPLDSVQQNIWDSTAKNFRFNVPYDRVIRVSASDEANLPGIAYRYLGDTSLWWVLLEYNGLTDPIEDLKVGMSLKIPQRKALIAYLESSRAIEESTVIL